MCATYRFHVLSIALLGLWSCTTKVTGDHSNLIGGTAEPDYRYPWVLSAGGCRGVLIDPRWVLTAAHCVRDKDVTRSSAWTYSRVDPYTGQKHSESRMPIGEPNEWAFTHTQFNSQNDFDIALIKLAEPLALGPYIQTVGLPSSPRVVGVVGTVATVNHAVVLPEGMTAIFRAPIESITPDFKITIFSSTNSGFLCPHDSGSGFVTYENGRAVVRGIASQSAVACQALPGHPIDFTDVFASTPWILETMRTVEYRLSGTTRVRWQGTGARGLMGLGCNNPYGTMWGPLNVRGVQIGANCEADQTQSAVCSLNEVQNGPLGFEIIGFTMRTTCAPHGTSEMSLPITPNFASYYGPIAQSPDPVGVCIREFVCQLGNTVIENPILKQ